MTSRQTVSTSSPAGLEPLLPLIAAKGGDVTPVEFHSSVNEMFHSHEASVYDRIHNDMRRTLPRHFRYLTDTFLEKNVLPERISCLDIGCGTGMSSALLLQTPLGRRISSLDLLDTSEGMLRSCARRAEIKSVGHRLIRGTLGDLPEGASYDVILMCSVLHHIPDLQTLFQQLSRVHRPGGLFLHLQDPNGDFMHDFELRRRTEEFEKSRTNHPRWAKRLTPERVVRKIRAALSGQQPRSYIDCVNDDLLRAGVIKEPLTCEELWSVTDIHIYNGNGISLRTLKKMLSGYELVAGRSYSFFGTMHSELGWRFRKEEDRLLEEGAWNGHHIAAAWLRAPGIGE